MPPTIYHYDRSPFCVAVIQALRAGGIEPRLVEVPGGDRAEIIKLTAGAYYQVPVVQDGDRVIYESGPDSQDVANYLDAHYLAGRLFPARWQGWQAIAMRYLENDVEEVTFKICDGVFLPTIADLVERTMLIRHKERKFGLGCVERWRRDRADLVATANKLLRPFEDILATGEHPFLLGDAPVYSDFLLYGIFANYTYGDLTPFPAGLPELQRWRQRLPAFRY